MFEKPIVEIKKFDLADVLTTSGGTDEAVDEIDCAEGPTPISCI